VNKIYNGFPVHPQLQRYFTIYNQFFFLCEQEAVVCKYIKYY